MHSNRYTLLYAIGFTTVVAIILAVTASSLRPLQAKNAAQAKRRAILESVMEVNPQTLEQDYNTYITGRVFDAEGIEVADLQAFDLDVKKESRKALSERRYPIYVFRKDSRTNYIIPLQGLGLWGPISAYLALDADRNAIHGVVFDHEKETPGLGAEITTASFQDQFAGKKLFREDGTFESVRVLKGAGHDIEGRAHVVDGLTGATMTLNGVNRMLLDEIDRYKMILQGIKP